MHFLLLMDLVRGFRIWFRSCCDLGEVSEQDRDRIRSSAHGWVKVYQLSYGNGDAPWV